MDEGDIYSPCSILLDQVHCLGDGTARVNLIIHQYHIPVFYIADDGKCLCFGVIGRPAFFNKSDRGINFVGKVAAFLGETEIHGDDHRVFKVRAQVFLDVIHQDRGGVQYIPGHGEKALDLIGMRVECHITVCTCYLDNIGHQAGGDRDAWLILFVRTPVAQVWNDSRNAGSRIQP